MNHGFWHMMFFIIMCMTSTLIVGIAVVVLLNFKHLRRTRAVNNAWVYGYVKGTRARLNTITNQCQFVLWKAGEQGHTEDFWHNMGDGWVKHFVADQSSKQKRNPR